MRHQEPDTLLMGDDPSSDRTREREAREGESERAVGDTHPACRKEGADESLREKPHRSRTR